MIQQFIFLSNSLLGQIAYLQHFLGDAWDGHRLITYSIIVVFICRIFGENTVTLGSSDPPEAGLVQPSATAAATDVRKQFVS